MRNKVIRVVLAIVLAATGTGVLMHYVEGAKAAAVAEEAQVNVLAVAAAVTKGTPAKELGDRVKTIQVPARLRAGDAVTNIDELGELRTTVDLIPGEQVVRARFAEAGTALRGKAPAGLLQVTITLGADRAVGGNLRPGDTVGVLISFASFDDVNGGGKTGDTTHLELHKIVVTNIQVAGQPTDASKANGEVPTAIGGNYLVTLAVTAPQSEQLVFAAEKGKIWLSAEPADASEDGTRIVDRTDAYAAGLQ
jgi:pilus assembly protein CpaB